jgi:starch phosphorylase
VSYKLHYVINEQGLNDAVGLEKVNLFVNKDGEERIFSVEPLELVGQDGNNFIFEATISPHQAGTYKSAVRMYPKNDKLPHRQDFSYVKWLELPNS